jgi:hypothetical protein
MRAGEDIGMPHMQHPHDVVIPSEPRVTPPGGMLPDCLAVPRLRSLLKPPPVLVDRTAVLG